MSFVDSERGEDDGWKQPGACRGGSVPHVAATHRVLNAPSSTSHRQLTTSHIISQGLYETLIPKFRSMRIPKTSVDVVVRLMPCSRLVESLRNKKRGNEATNENEKSQTRIIGRWTRQYCLYCKPNHC